MTDQLHFVASNSPANSLAILKSPILSSLLLVAAVLSYVYWRGFPKPLPGIPYNEQSLKSFLGDLPAVQQARTQHGKGFTVWMRDLAHQHQSPLVQVFLGPFAAPALVLYDYRESYDILARRTKDFDRDGRGAGTMATILPEHHTSMFSADPRFKGNKELVKDLMTPAFLNEVSALEVYSKASSLIELWILKSKWADCHPFEAHYDLQNASMDIIMAAAFGDTSGGNVVQKHVLQEQAYKPVVVPKHPAAPAIFEKIELPTEYQVMIDITNFMGLMFTSPLPKYHAWILKKFTRIGDVFAAKDRFIKSQIHRAVNSLGDAKMEVRTTKSALEFMVQREVAAAKKAERQPIFNSRKLEDELLGYITAGFETSASVFCWIMKFLADNQEQQLTLRKHLQETYRQAMSETRQPNVTELTKITVPYLDAFIEECVRLAPTASITTRQALKDTTVLGHFVPTGTSIFLHTQGPSYVQPALHVDERLRSISSQGAKLVPDWPSHDVAKFRTERWLVPGSQESSEMKRLAKDFEFDGRAGPVMTFGGGPRGCFGKRLAYMELKMVVALLVWNFVFKPCTEELSSYELHESITVEPKFCYVNLEKVQY